MKRPTARKRKGKGKGKAEMKRKGLQFYNLQFTIRNYYKRD